MKTWCRLHSDIRMNVKIWNVSRNALWSYICWLTFETDGSLDNNPSREWLAMQCRRTVEELEKDLAELRGAELLDDENRVVNFDERQYQEGASTERVRKFRKRFGNVSGNGFGNDPDQNRTETEQSREEQIPPSLVFDLSSKQKKFAGSLLEQAGESWESWAGSKGLTRITSKHVDQIVAGFKDPADRERAALDRKNARCRELKAALDEIHTRDGPDAVRKWIRQQDKEFHSALWIRFKEIDQ